MTRYLLAAFCILPIVAAAGCTGRGAGAGSTASDPSIAGGAASAGSAATADTARAVAPGDLATTLQDLATFGQKRVGTPAGHAAAAYIQQRMMAAGLDDVHEESFDFPRHDADLASSSLSVTKDGQDMGSINFDIFEGSGAGQVSNAEVVYVGNAKPEDLTGVDLHGKIAFVERNASYHRSSQYRNVSQAGAVAMLYMSTATDNLIQIGSIRWAWEPMGPIPAITIGKDDGDRIWWAWKLGSTIRASIDVHASTAHATGQNVIGKVIGADPTHQIVIGAHYDTWYTGSVDNGSGVAGLLAFAAKRVGSRPPYTLVFVAYDGEEVALYGGYDYLRKHQNEGILAVINLEMPSDKTDLLAGGVESAAAGIASSALPLFNSAFRDSGLAGVLGGFVSAPYKLWITLDYVTQEFGGIIPTDIQGIYRAGFPTVSTATDSPYYHTPADTPDKVDIDFLGRAIDRFDAALTLLLAAPVSAFKGHDPTLWNAAVTVTQPGQDGGAAAVDVTLTDASGAVLAGQTVTATLFCDDFFAQPDVTATTDAQGHAHVRFSAAQLASCQPNRYVHVSAGTTYPLVEQARVIQ